MKLGTKAENLSRLYGMMQNASVLSSCYFTLRDWNENRDKCWDKASVLGSSLIVRSSCLDEDRGSASNAGKYLSVRDIKSKESFLDAVERVFASYVDRDRPPNSDDQVLVQPMLEDVSVCGVAFTMDPNTGGHYDVINYDTSGSTDGITSGSSKKSRLFYHFKCADDIDNSNNVEFFIPKLLLALRELEQVFEIENLDVEFAVDKENSLYVLQVRELCIKAPYVTLDEQTETLKEIYKKVSDNQQKKPFLCGDRALYSVMTDWNPAEMIGIYPRKLALSLYREIITDSVWAYQRDNYGYRNLRSFPLLVDLGGVPYIDVRVSFNSFVPAELDEKISDKLVNYYLDRLTDNPAEHDKAEFNIVFSCFTFDLPERINVLKRYGFSDDEIKQITDALRDVTNQIIDHATGLWRKDYSKVEKLIARYDEIVSSNMSDIEKVYWLLEDCKRYGTLPFAGLARGAFVAVQLLRSMVSVGIMSQEDYDGFMNGLNSISSQMNNDLCNLTQDEFMKKYGHLRPGTYDITTPRYDEACDRYFDWKNSKTNKNKKSEKEFRISIEQMHRLRDHVNKCGLNNDILELLDFIKKVIEGREYGKYVFTRNLSKSLQLIGEIGKQFGYTLDDMSYIDIHSIYELFSSSKDAKTAIRESIIKGRKEQQVKTPLRMPPIIIRSSDVLSFYYPDSEPSFITLGTVTGEVIDISNVNMDENLSGKILMIPGADPGYDWIFSKGVSGFITMYGGANSHMAIRAGELSIPAVIGIGEKNYEKYCNGMYIEINAALKQITILK